MSRNGSGTYNLPLGNPVVTGTTITSTWANTTLTDIANALTGSVAADGQTPMTGALNMNSNKVSSLANGTLPNDAVNFSQLSAPIITGGSIDNCPIGLATPSTGAFSTLSTTGAATFGTNGTFSGTGSLKLPTGTTAQRDTTALGLIRFNSTLMRFEGCVGVTAGAAISTLTRVSTTATLTTATNHNLNTGDTITVSGAIPTAFNGTYQITVTGVNIFTYTMATTPGSDATTVGSYNVATWSGVGGGATGGGSDQIFVQNGQTVTTNYTIPSGQNASSAGPITINTGVTVTVPSGSYWVII